MPTISVELTDEVAQALARQARALLLGRQAYVRALLALVARDSDGGGQAPAAPPCQARVVPGSAGDDMQPARNTTVRGGSTPASGAADGASGSGACLLTTRDNRA